MNPFGVTPKCPTCDKNVYAAEQVMGPGRVMYHKLCLKCVSCSRRLDSLSLREHNREPYCNTCHVRNFGTRDLRSANVIPDSPTASPSPTRRTFRSPSPPSLPPRSQSSQHSSVADLSSTIPEESENAEPNGTNGHMEDDSAPSSASTAPALPARPPSRSFPRPPSRTSSSTTTSTSFTSQPNTFRLSATYTGSRPIARSPSPTKSFARPLSPTATGSSSSSGIAPTYLRSTHTGASSNGATSPLRPSFTGNVTGGAVRRAGVKNSYFGGGTPSCPRCEKAVYFAEQVKAASRTWHKNCLRCTECSTLLDSSRITEKDGEVMCRSCYSKMHGPIGSGYGLLGRAG